MAVSLEKKPQITDHQRASTLLHVIKGEQVREGINDKYRAALQDAEAALNNLKRFW